MKRILLSLVIFFAASYNAAAELSVLTYHEIKADPGDDIYSVSRSTFVAQMDYLEEQGYRVLSLEQLNDLYHRKAPIPKKSVMLTFDDGLLSYYKFVVPVLATYGFPSVASVVTSWVDGVNVPEEYVNKLMHWEELKKLANNPLVEIISHTNNLHHGIQSNPQGNEAAASVTRKYFVDTKKYETEEDFRQRIYLDLKQSVDRFKTELGFVPQGIAWPYGLYDDVTSKEATLLGMNFQMSLDRGASDLNDLPNIKRIMLVKARSVADMVNELEYTYREPENIKLAYLRLEDFSGLSKDGQEVLLSKMLDTIESANIQEVVINPFYAEKNQAFFANEQMDVSTDILNRVTHQLKYRLSIKNIILDLPTITGEGLNLEELYTDLARLNWFDGIVVSAQNYSNVEPIISKMRRYRPGLKFGLRNGEALNPEMDIAVFTERSIKGEIQLHELASRINNMPVKSFLLVKLNKTMSNTTVMLNRMQALGVKRMGIAAGIKDFIDYYDQQFAEKAVASVGEN